jgi:tetratricopeptide (TPR) repeat protein
LLLTLNDPQSAIKQFTAALQLDPNRQNSLLGRGEAEYFEGNLDAAVTDLSRASEIRPFALANFWLGRALESKGQLEAAANEYRAALQLAPDMAEARQRLESLHVALR